PLNMSFFNTRIQASHLPTECYRKIPPFRLQVFTGAPSASAYNPASKTYDFPRIHRTAGNCARDTGGTPIPLDRRDQRGRAAAIGIERTCIFQSICRGLY